MSNNQLHPFSLKVIVDRDLLENFKHDPTTSYQAMLGEDQSCQIMNMDNLKQERSTWASKAMFLIAKKQSSLLSWGKLRVVEILKEESLRLIRSNLIYYTWAKIIQARMIFITDSNSFLVFRPLLQKRMTTIFKLHLSEQFLVLHRMS